jgi:hypothetical protein
LGIDCEKEIVMEDFADIHALFTPKQDREGLSQVERLLGEFEAHEAKEEQVLEEYKKSLAGVTQPVTRFVIQLILSDEEKHRAVTHAMISTLKGSLTWTKPAGSLEGDVAPAAEADQLLAVTERFLELEKAGLREYKTFLKESADYYQGLFKILLNSMVRDSEKHVELLEFLRARLKDQ